MKPIDADHLIRNTKVGQQGRSPLRAETASPPAPATRRRIRPPIAKSGPADYDYYVDGQLRPEYWRDARDRVRQRPTERLPPAPAPSGRRGPQRTYHFITPNTQGRRLTPAFFVGVTADDRPIIWA